MTFRENLQECVEHADKIYCSIGNLRDHATQEQKDVFNDLRKKASEIIQKMNQLDNSLEDWQAQSQV